TGLTAALNGKASTSHNHDADYAAIDHDHDEDYAAAGHNHDADYAAIDHDHDEDYAAAGHTHTAGEVSGLAAVATSGAYSDLSGTPSIPSGDQLMTGSATALADLEGAPAMEDFNALLAVLRTRSEEHTSELQSRENLVCRLLLE